MIGCHRLPQVHSEPEREALSGKIERVTFHSPDSGFYVLRVKVRGHRDLVTLIGSAGIGRAGDYNHAIGRWGTTATMASSSRLRS